MSKLDMMWTSVNGGNPGQLGLIPSFLSPVDGRDAVTQMQQNYAHGGGWNDFDGFKLITHDGEQELPIKDWRLTYPGDPAYRPLWYTYLASELVVLWPYSWMTVHPLDQDGGVGEVFRCARID